MTNPKLRAFIPLFYLVWSDDLLTQKEFLTLQEFIGSQNWLSEKEKELLFSKVNVLTPPSREQLIDWKSEIEKIIQDKPSVRSIFDVSIILSENDKTIIDLGPAFIKLENDLGIFGEEVMVDFKTSVNTFTSNSQTVKSFDTEKLTQILDGKEAAIIKKVKSVISHPEFAYETSTEKLREYGLSKAIWWRRKSG
jgi:acyl-CoA oxidase